MNMELNALQIALVAAALLQLAIAGLNPFLIRIMKWEEDLERMSLLVREVFVLHCWFIGLTLTIFAALTLRFAPEMSTGGHPAVHWIAGAIAIFWGIRAVLQVTHYSASHWRGHQGRTVIHGLILVIYPAFAVIYGMAALAG